MIYTIIVDSKKKYLLSSIRKHYFKRQLENIYFNQWNIESYEWLHNDIYGWINNGRGTLFFITGKMKHIFKRSFDVEIKNLDDIDAFEAKRSSKTLWNIYVNCLTEDEFYDFYKSIINLEEVKNLLSSIHS